MELHQVPHHQTINVSPGTGSLTHFLLFLSGLQKTRTYNNHARLPSLRLASICMRLSRAIRTLPASALARSGEAWLSTLPICCIVLVFFIVHTGTFHVSVGTGPLTHYKYTVRGAFSTSLYMYILHLHKRRHRRNTIYR